MVVNGRLRAPNAAQHAMFVIHFINKNSIKVSSIKLVEDIKVNIKVAHCQNKC